MLEPTLCLSTRNATTSKRNRNDNVERKKQRRTQLSTIISRTATFVAEIAKFAVIFVKNFRNSITM